MEIALIILSIACVMLALFAYGREKKITILQEKSANDEKEFIRLREEAASMRAKIEYSERLNIQTQRLHDENVKQNLSTQEAILKQTENRFRVLANEILKNQATEMQTRNAADIGHLLNPLKDDIERFRRDVTNFYSKESAERFSLQEKIKDLIEANQTIGKEARELSTALRGNSKIQGDWGELILEQILENSGLRKGEEFEVQMQRDEEGNVLQDESGHGLRPDVVVRYPGDKVMVIDSKVSLTAFVDYVNADTQEDRERYGKLHLASVMKHISELSEKKYQDYVGKEKLDFVMMFVPNEGAYSAALTLDPGLWQKAYDKRVLIVSPTQLVASLKIVAQLWRHDRQTRNAIDIAERSGAMYDKFVGFVQDMEKIEKSINATQTAYTSAMKKLRDGTGSLITRAEKLRELGVKASKRLPKGDE